MAQQLNVQYVNYYCAGSSALKVDTAVELKTLAFPRRRKIKKLVLHIDPVAFAGILIATVMTILLAVGFVQLNEARAEEIAMAAYVASLEESNEALKDTFESGYNLAQVEEVALALGMVPAEQLQTVTVRATEPVQEERAGGWNVFWAAVVELFA